MFIKMLDSRAKRIIFSILAVALILGVFLAAIELSSRTSNKGIQFESDGWYPANFRQDDSTVQLGIVDGELYMFNNMRETLYRYELNGFKKVRHINGSWIGTDGNYIYFRKYSRDKTNLCPVVRYDAENGKSDEVTKAVDFSHSDVFSTQDGYFYIPIDKENDSYLCVDGSGAVDSVLKTESYKVGEWTFEVCDSQKKEYIVAKKPDGSTISYQDELGYGDKEIIPCEKGLLIHNRDNSNILSFIDCESGEYIVLVSAECIYSQSAVNVCGNLAFFSLIRYTEWGPLGLAGVSEEGDPINGTYRIDLNECSVEKLNDDVYCGLFVYDDNGIYACDLEDRVYYLGLDGTVITELTKR